MTHLELLGVDIKKLSVVHVAGTKGKGSVCALTESIVRAHGFTTGTFISPHLVEPRERIRLQGRPISRDMFAKYFFETEALLSAKKDAPLPPFFRFLSAMAFLVFQREQVQLAVVEVGVGGRTCSTNVVHPVVTAITRLGYDHMDVLGPTLTNIAFEKAGIMKHGAPCFSSPQEPEPAAELERVAAERLVKLQYVSASDMPPGCPPLALEGEHQRSNAALALRCARFWLASKGCFVGASVETDSLCDAEQRGLAEARWRGRAQSVPWRGLTLHLDGAHTAESTSLALNWFAGKAGRREEEGAPALVCNFKPNKQVDEMLALLAARGPWGAVVFSPSAAGGAHDCSWQRGLAARWPAAAGPAHVAKNLDDALVLVRQHSPATRHVLVTGSLYLVGAALELVEWPVDDL